MRAPRSFRKISALGAGLMLGPMCQAQETGGPALKVTHRQNTTTVPPYEVFEITFKHDGDYSNPLFDVTIDMTLTAPSGKRIDRLRVSGTDVPWVYCSGYRDARRLWFTLLDKKDGPAKYTVRLHFAEPKDLQPGRRVFHVRLQGEPVLTGFDLVKEAGGARKALVKQFEGVEVQDVLFVEMSPSEDSEIQEPILCGIQAFAE